MVIDEISVEHQGEVYLDITVSEKTAKINY
jgi:hypothetical protein